MPDREPSRRPHLTRKHLRLFSTLFTVFLGIAIVLKSMVFFILAGVALLLLATTGLFAS